MYRYIFYLGLAVFAILLVIFSKPVSVTNTSYLYFYLVLKFISYAFPITLSLFGLIGIGRIIYRKGVLFYYSYLLLLLIILALCVYQFHLISLSNDSHWKKGVNGKQLEEKD